METTPRHRGRPRIGPRLTVRVEPAQLAWLDQEAAHAGISRGAVLRIWLDRIVQQERGQS
jgi:hypothetical protein